MTAELAEWPREEGPVPDALWMADMTTGPRGQAFDYDERLAEILDRYDADSIVGRAMTRPAPRSRQRSSGRTSALRPPPR